MIKYPITAYNDNMPIAASLSPTHISTPLLHAVINDNLDAVKQIGVSITREGFANILLTPLLDSGYSVLMIAIAHGHTGIVQYFLNALTTAHVDIAAAIMQSDKLGRSPLMYAVYRGHSTIVALLLQSLSTHYANTQAAVYRQDDSLTDNTSLIDLLRQMVSADTGASPLAQKPSTFSDSRVLTIARSRGLGESCHSLLTLLHQINTAVSHALQLSDTTNMAKLSRKQQKRHDYLCDQHTIVHYLLDQINTESFASLVDALHSADIDMRVLLNHADHRGHTALMCASIKGYTDIVTLLIQCLQDTNAYSPEIITSTNFYGWSPLLYAVHYGHLPIVQYYLDLLRTADTPITTLVNHTNKQGQTALSLAMQCDNRPMVTLLLAHGAKLITLSPERIAGLHTDDGASAFAAGRLMPLFQQAHHGLAQQLASFQQALRAFSAMGYHLFVHKVNAAVRNTLSHSPMEVHAAVRNTLRKKTPYENSADDCQLTAHTLFQDNSQQIRHKRSTEPTAYVL